MIKTIKDLQEAQKSNPTAVATARSIMADLVNQYEEFVVSSGDEHPRAAGVHASEVSGCMRRMVYSMGGTEARQSFDISWKKRFMVGHALHAMIQKQFHSFVDNRAKVTWNIKFQDEVRINPESSEVAKEFNIFSSTDGLFLVSEDDKVILSCVLEIKTESPNGFARLKKPKQEHIEQAHVYMACLNSPFTWFLYWNKGDQDYTKPLGGFLVEFDIKVWDSILEKIKSANTYLDSNSLPLREESPACSFCSYSYTCKPASANRIGQSHSLVQLGSKIPGRK